jgi:hypothetical protein
MARPRNQFRIVTNVNIDAGAYDKFRALTAGRSTQAAITDLVRWFNSQPEDVRELLLSRISKANQVKVLRAVIRQMRK